MKLFIDSADIQEIEKAYAYGILDGVTTNPSLIKKAAQKHKVTDMKEYIKKILEAAQKTPVSLEVIGQTFEEITSEAEMLYKTFNSVAKNVVVKIPISTCTKQPCIHNADALKAIAHLSAKGIPINCTLIFTPEQALLAAKAGAAYVSPFAGRIDDNLRTKANIPHDKTDYFPADGIEKRGKQLEDKGIVSGIDLVEQCVDIFEEYDIETEVLAASIRNTQQFRECALAGSDIATVPLKVIETLLQHEQTMQGMKNFTKDIVPEYKQLFK